MTSLLGFESDDASAGITTDSEDGRAGTTSLTVPSRDTDIREYGKTLGVDPDSDGDLQWLVQEAFAAELPQSWTEHHDEDGRVYFYNQLTQVSSWSHPTDSVFRELIQVVKAFRAEQPTASQEKRLEAVHAHLQAVRERAIGELDSWSGPYASEEGAYFYNSTLGASVWNNPVDEWQVELELRQRVLLCCLCSERGRPTPIATESAALDYPRLGLGAVNLKDSAPLPQSPSSARSFASARSNITGRSLTPPRTRQPLTQSSRPPLQPRQQQHVQQHMHQQQQQEQSFLACPAGNASFANMAEQLQQQSNQQQPAQKKGERPSESVSSAAPAEPAGTVGEKPKVVKAAADEGEDSDSPLEFTFGRTSPVTMPKLDK